MFQDDFPRLQERYELTDRKLGQGGYGTVLRAYDRRTGQAVAIKVLKNRRTGIGAAVLAAKQQDRALLRFKRGGEIQLMLSGDDPRRVDPNLVFVHAYGLVRHKGAEVPALVMDLCPGPTLEDLLKTGTPIPLTTVVDWGRQIASVLFRAGARDVVHRDLKPSNVIVVDAPHGGLVKVLDFGIARFIRSRGPSRMFSTTIDGHSPMTGLYASPEQRRFRPLDHRSDLYSFGVMLSELLHTGLYGTMSEYEEAFPQALRELVDQLQAFDPDDRPQDALQVYQALTRIRTALEAETVRGRPAEISAGPPAPVRRSAELSREFAGLAVELTQRFSPMHPDTLEQRQAELRFAARAGEAVGAAEWSVLTQDYERAVGRSPGAPSGRSLRGEAAMAG
ncbi:serine/threonine-protein kinase [Streptomyces glaucus]|uniref:Protein kinase domain-containing protein n=1 Tax=Streptomyces glaucus TaxID=284029 RepID=A0ABN3J3M2_9ACTN